MSTNKILLNKIIKGSIFEIILNNPSKRNPISLELILELQHLFDSIKNEALREAFIGMSFQHPNIVRTLGCVYDQKPSANMPTGNIMIIME